MSLKQDLASLDQSGDKEVKVASDKMESLQKQWDHLHQLVKKRIQLAMKYVTFHKKAQQVRSLVKLISNF